MATETIQRVRVYLRENDRAADGPLYLAILDTLRRGGASGATVLRGLEGFGPSERLRLGGAVDHGAPLIVEWLDRADRIERLLPTLDALAPTALITVETVPVYRAALHAGGPFPPDLSCAAAGSAPPTLRPEQDLAAAAALLATHGPLVVCDAEERVVGLLSPSDLPRRARLLLPLRLLPFLTTADQQLLREALASRSVHEAMSHQPRCLDADAPVAMAAAVMTEWGLDQLPLLNAHGHYAGLLTLPDVLRAAAAPADSRTVRLAGQATGVRLVMQTAVPQLAASEKLPAIVERLLATPARFLVVTEDEQPVGALTDVLLLERLDAAAQPQVLAALASGTLRDELPSTLSAAELAVPWPTIGQEATLFQAITAMLVGETAWLPVTDEGRLVGLLSERVLLRALAHEQA